MFTYPVFGGGGLVGDLSSIKTNLMAWWTLDQTSGTRTDSHGSYHLNLPYGTTSYRAGKHGNAFDTTNAGFYAIDTAGSAAFNFGHGDFSLAGWFYLDTFQLNRALLSKIGAQGWMLYFDAPVSNRLSFWISGSPLAAHTWDAGDTGRWVFVKAYHDGVNDEVGLALDDADFTTEAYSGGTGSTNNYFLMGAYNNIGGQIDGALDEWGIWNRVLTPAEWVGLYNAGAGVAYGDLP